MRKILASLTIVSTLIAPVSALAAQRPVADIVDATAQTVSRIDFLVWATEMVGLTKSSDCTLTYKRFPKGHKATLCLAKNSGALDAFGKQTMNYNLNVAITRGEAVDVLTQLIGKRKEADVSAFADVKTTRQKQAVMNAIALKWMSPKSPTLFGYSDTLSGAEASSLLQEASKSVPLQITVKFDRITQTPPDTSTLPKKELMDSVWKILQNDYLHKDKIDSDEAAYQAIEAMVKSVNDPYTTFFRPEGASQFSSGIKGSISGIGANVEERSGSIYVVSPLPGSPAEKAGILSGDQIVEADGHPLAGIGLEKAVGYIRGEKGTTVELKIRRAGSDITVKVLRDTITIPEVSVKWQGDIAIVQLVQFGETTENQIRSVFTDIAKKNPKGVVLDLRNNPGGLLTAADIVASNFLPNGSVVAKVKGPNDSHDETTSSDPTIPNTVKMVVLVNKGSASASEIVSGALQDHKRATIIGEQTFGKGSVQEVLSFTGGEALKVTVANYFTPNGNIVDGVGIKPDIVVPADDRDSQLQRALDLLR